MKDKIYSLLERIEEAESVDEIVAALQEDLGDLGFEYFFVGEVAGVLDREPIRIGNYDPEWVERFFKYDYQVHDPIVNSLVLGGNDVAWAELKRSLTRGSKARRIMNEAGDFGLKDGWAFPIYGPNGYLAGVSFSGKQIDDDPNVRRALRLLSTYAHSKLQSFHATETRSPAKLTVRERDVLMGVAQGHNDSQIGEILCISESTVHMHVERAKTKLGATKRTNAVVEAIRQRQLLL